MSLVLYYSKTPNGAKPAILLNYMKQRKIIDDFKIVFVNIAVGDQFTKEFLQVSPNNKIPALVDHSPADGKGPIAVMESGAILVYLAEKYSLTELLPPPSQPRERADVLQWLFWQTSSQGPMLGQNHHFTRYAPVKLEYAMSRYTVEAERLYGVLNTLLSHGRPFMVGDKMTLADIATYPWCQVAAWHFIDTADYPHVKAWVERMRAVDFVKTAQTLALPKDDRQPTYEDRIRLFGIKKDVLERLNLLPPSLESEAKQHFEKRAAKL